MTSIELPGAPRVPSAWHMGFEGVVVQSVRDMTIRSCSGESVGADVGAVLDSCARGRLPVRGKVWVSEAQTSRWV